MDHDADSDIGDHPMENPGASCENTHTSLQGVFMSTPKQKTAARRNVKKAAAAAKGKKTISHLSKATRTALGKQGAKVAQAHRSQH